MPLCPGLSGCAGTRKVKPIWILLKQETVSGSGIHWAICRSAPRSTQITMPAPHCSVFYSPDALPATQPTVSKHWRQILFSGTLPQTLDLQKNMVMASRLCCQQSSSTFVLVDVTSGRWSCSWLFSTCSSAIMLELRRFSFAVDLLYN